MAFVVNEFGVVIKRGVVCDPHILRHLNRIKQPEQDHGIPLDEVYALDACQRGNVVRVKFPPRHQVDAQDERDTVRTFTIEP